MPKLEIPFPAANGNVGRVILVGKISVYPYEGKRTSEIPIGKKVRKALQDNRFF